MTNPLTSREAPDPMTLTGFSKRSQSEIDHNLFAAKTGGLVAISAPSFWEMYYAAQAWHAHLRNERPAPLGFIHKDAADLHLSKPSGWAHLNAVATDAFTVPVYAAPLAAQPSDTQGDGT